MLNRTVPLLCAILALLPGAAGAWSQAAQELAQRAEAEFSGRLVVLRSLAQGAARALPAEARQQLHDADQGLFRRVVFKGVITPFRQHWFDPVRCAIYVPDDPDNSAAELWAMAHEIGHCVARLGGWQASLWTDPDVVVRHRVESWADAFATLAVPPSQRSGLTQMALQQRAKLGGDAAYMTDKAIRCSAALPDAAARSLTETGLVVEQLLRGACLTDDARLRATEAFLATVR